MSKTSRRSPSVRAAAKLCPKARNRELKAITIGLGAALGALALASEAWAQSAPPAEAPAVNDIGQAEIVVLGNRRATQALDSASLVDLLSRDELEQGGAVTLQETSSASLPPSTFRKVERRWLAERPRAPHPFGARTLTSHTYWSTASAGMVQWRLAAPFLMAAPATPM